MPNRQFVNDVAKAALKAGGIAEGTKIELNMFNQSPYTDIAQVLRASFAKAGIEISVRPLIERKVLAKMRDSR